MAVKSKLIALLGVFLFCTSLQNRTCSVEPNVKICVSKMTTKELGIDYYMIAYEDTTSDKRFKSFVRGHLLYFQFHAKDAIRLISGIDTIAPVSYIFEDDVDGILPVYKQIVGFELGADPSSDKKLKINFSNIHTVIDIN